MWEKERRREKGTEGGEGGDHLIPRFPRPGRINLFHRFSVGSTNPVMPEHIPAEHPKKKLAPLPIFTTTAGKGNNRVKGSASPKMGPNNFSTKQSVPSALLKSDE